MPYYLRPAVILLLLSVTAGTAATAAEVLGQGDVFPITESVDQHDNKCVVSKDTRYVAVSFTMSDGKKANRYFEEKGKDFLPGNKAVFIANIHGMPGVARVFAMPKMRKYPHTIMLADEEGLLDPLPQQKDRITVFELDGENRILSISFWDPSADKDPF